MPSSQPVPESNLQFIERLAMLTMQKLPSLTLKACGSSYPLHGPVPSEPVCYDWVAQLGDPNTR